MFNTNSHANLRDYSYLTSGPLLPVSLERMIRSWLNRFHKSCFSLPVFGISYSFDLQSFHSLHALRNYTPVSAACSVRIIWIFTYTCSAECVSQGVLQIIREAPNGSIWVSEEEKPSYQVIIPSLQSLKAEWMIFGKGCLLTRRILESEAFHWLPNRRNI
jgi:hypothetical protein